MHRTDADGHVGNQFSPGDEEAGVRATQIDAPWLNAVQEEVVNVILAAGLTLTKGTNTQLRDALRAMGLQGGTAGQPGQFKFPATQNPSTDANTLDDYEESTWTPVLGGAGGVSGQTYGSRVGHYVKIGKLVTASCTLTLTAKGTITGDVEIQGLPFASETPGPFYIAAVSHRNLSTNWITVNAVLAPGTSVAGLRGSTAAGANNDNPLAGSDISNTTVISVTLVYRAAA